MALMTSRRRPSEKFGTHSTSRGEPAERRDSETGCRAEHGYGARSSERTSLLGRRIRQMVGARGSQLRRDLRPLARPELGGMDAQAVTQSLRPTKDGARLAGRKGRLFAPHVAIAGQTPKCRQHLLDDGPD